MSIPTPWKTLLSLARLPFATSTHPAPASGKPVTIPALKEWSAGSAIYAFSPQARILVRHPELAATARTFAEDLHALTGQSLPVLEDVDARTGDIVLALGEAALAAGLPGEQGYQLEITELATITAPCDEGVFYGTRTLLQLLRQSYTISGGTAHDWPDYPQRGLMVDVGRQYFSLSWLENRIRDLAYLKYNFFHLHFSDNFGFRLENERHPEIVSQPFYSKADIRALQELASKYHITIVPEIDVPGHLDAALAEHPELRLASETGYRQSGDLDLANEAAYTFVRDLLEEYIPLFSGPCWHLGADEYLLHGGTYSDFPQLEKEARIRYGAQACAKDIYLGFVNWAHEIVKSYGKTTRVWSDGLYGGEAITPAAEHIIYEHWVSWGLSPREIVERGIPIVNCNIHSLYYVPGSERMPADPKALYESFEPHHFCAEFNVLDNVEGITVPEGSAVDERDLDSLKHHPLLLGTKLHVWCDDPTVETEAQIAAAIEDALRALAQKNWGSPRIAADYESFKALIATIGHAPGATKA